MTKLISLVFVIVANPQTVDNLVSLTLSKLNIKISPEAGDCRGDAARASDGDRETCVVSKPSTYSASIWEVSFYKPYTISKIIIYAGLGVPLLHGIQVQVSDDPNSMQANTVVCWTQRLTQKHPKTKIEADCDISRQPSRVVQIINNTSLPLYLCEVEILAKGKSCFGKDHRDDCTKNCHCKSNASCNQDTGECPNKECHTRYTGSDCQQTCNEGKYFVNGECTGVCHCFRNSTCRVNDGRCGASGCKAHFSGNRCEVNLSGEVDDATIGGEEDGIYPGIITGSTIGVLVVLVSIIGGYYHYTKKIKPDLKGSLSVPATPTPKSRASSATPEQSVKSSVTRSSGRSNHTTKTKL